MFSLTSIQYLPTVNRVHAETTLIRDQNLTPLIKFQFWCSRAMFGRATLRRLWGFGAFIGTYDFKPTSLSLLLTVRSLMLVPRTSCSTFLVWIAVWRLLRSVCNAINRPSTAVVERFLPWPRLLTYFAIYLQRLTLWRIVDFDLSNMRAASMYVRPFSTIATAPAISVGAKSPIMNWFTCLLSNTFWIWSNWR